MNDQHDQYKELAGWDPYVKKLIDRLQDVQWERIRQQVSERAGKVPRLRGANRPVANQKRRVQRAKLQLEWMRDFIYICHVKQDAAQEPHTISPRAYEAQRLNSISRVLGTYQRFGGTISGEMKWVPNGKLGRVLDGGDRDPSTVGWALGLVDWFQHCLAAFEGRTVALAVKPVKITALSPLEQVLGEGFTVEQLDALAHAVGLVNDARQYCLGDRRKGAFTGFCRALQDKTIPKAAGGLAAVVYVVASHFGVKTKVRDTDTNIADKFYKDTKRALNNPVPTN